MPWSQIIHCRMFSLRYLLVSSAILTIIGVTYAKVVIREESRNQVKDQELDLDRKRINQKCSGYALIVLMIYAKMTIIVEHHRKCILIKDKKSSYRIQDLNRESLLKDVK